MYRAPNLVIRRDEVTEHAPLAFCACAADIGLAPALWPRTIHTNELGNGQPFQLRVVDDDGTHHYVQTITPGGNVSACATLEIFND